MYLLVGDIAVPAPEGAGNFQYYYIVDPATLVAAGLVGSSDTLLHGAFLRGDYLNPDPADPEYGQIDFGWDGSKEIIIGSPGGGIEGNDLSRTWIMRRADGRVGSHKVIPKAASESPLMWADVFRLLAVGDDVDGAAPITVVCTDDATIVAGGIGSTPDLIYFYLMGGVPIVDDETTVDVVISFSDTSGRPVECRGPLLVV